MMAARTRSTAAKAPTSLTLITPTRSARHCRFDIGNVAGNSAITINGVDVGLDDQHRAGHLPRRLRQRQRQGRRLRSTAWSATPATTCSTAGSATTLLSGGLGNDTLIGGEGLDTATYVNSTAGVTVDLRIAGRPEHGRRRHRYADRHRISDRVELRRHPARQRRLQPDHRQRRFRCGRPDGLAVRLRRQRQHPGDPRCGERSPPTSTWTAATATTSSSCARGTLSAALAANAVGPGSATLTPHWARRRTIATSTSSRSMAALATTGSS